MNQVNQVSQKGYSPLAHYRRGKGSKMRIPEALRPDIQKIGFALFLSINSTSVWGGVYPYLPADMRTTASTMVFYGLQLFGFSATYLVFMHSSFFRLKMTRHVRVMRGAVPLMLSGLMLIATMYAPAGTLALVIASALLLGFGMAYFMVAWQKVFAAEDALRAGVSIITGFGYSTVAYMLLCLIPVAICAYLIPLVLVPLAALCLWMAAEEIDYDQPMFNDNPSEHSSVYLNAIRQSLPAALCIGALGFCAGAVRFVLIAHQSLSSFINLVTMSALLVASLGYLLVWSTRTIRFDVRNFYEILFPIVGIGLFFLPFSTTEMLATAGAAISNACYMLALMVMMIYCGQISRDNGVDPVFLYAFYGLVAYLLQLLGYLTGFLSGADLVVAGGGLPLVTSASLLVLLAASLLMGRGRAVKMPQIELLSLAPTTVELAETVEPVNPVGAAAASTTPAVPVEAPVVDRTAENCRRAAQRYGLSAREAEVMELLARGNTGPMIAGELFISENTVRTHIKRIYAKMDVGKKRDMLVLIGQ